MAVAVQPHSEVFGTRSRSRTPREPLQSWSLPEIARNRQAMAAVLLETATLAVFLPTAGFQFVGYDDPKTVSMNPHMREGFTSNGIRWLFAGEGDYWDPLTRLTHMAVYEIAGGQAPSHHFVNVLLHLAAVVALLDLLVAALGGFWRPLFVAAVFALHPLQVETIAWVTQRNGIVAALFLFLALRQWLRFETGGGRSGYFWSIAFFALALAGKPTAVTMPILLVAFDSRRFERARMLEKLPFFALSAGAAAATLYAQSNARAFEALAAVSPWFRFQNALATYGTLLWKAFAPFNLAALYPYPSSIPAWKSAAAAAAIIALSVGAWMARKSVPIVTAGWVWFLVTLAPVSGIVQAGLRAHTDHSMYIPIIGLGAAVAWGVTSLVPMGRGLVGVGLVATAAMAAASTVQSQYWRDTEALYRRAATVVENNALALSGLGAVVALDSTRREEAIGYLETALRIDPKDVSSHENLGDLLAAAGNLDEAIRHEREAVRLAPDDYNSHTSLARVLLKNPAMREEAYREATEGLRRAPAESDAHGVLASVLATDPAKVPDALREFRKALELDQGNMEAHLGIGKLLSSMPGGGGEAMEHFAEVDRLHPHAASEPGR